MATPSQMQMMAKSIGEPNPLDVVLGLRIRDRRTTLRLSQTAVAEAIGLTFQQVQKYEKGTNRVSFSKLVGIAHALDCRVVDLIGDLDDSDASPALPRIDGPNLRVRGAADLLTAYAALPPVLKKALVKLLREIAKAQAAWRVSA